MGRIVWFLFGGVLGGALVWLYEEDIRRYVDERTRVARRRTADRLGAAAEGLEAVRERIEEGLTGDDR